MVETDVSGTGAWRRDSTAFTRLLNLSDGVFAIAMTLLVFTFTIPSVPDDELGAELLGRIPQLVTIILSFAVVATLWWQHRQFVELLAFVEPGLVAMNLALLGAVALVPVTTGLVGTAPTSAAAVLPFIGLFVVLSVLYMLLLLRARQVAAWARPVGSRGFAWLVAGWASGIVVMLAAMALAVWFPVGGLALLAVTVVLGPASARISRRRLAFHDTPTDGLPDGPASG